MPGEQHVQRDTNRASDVVAVSSPVVFLAASVLASFASCSSATAPASQSPAREVTKAASASKPPQSAPWKTSLERTGCLGTCPSYWVEVKSDGNVRYGGVGNVRVEGLQAAVLGPDACARIFRKAEDIKLFEMSYQCGFKIFDIPHVIIEATDGGRSVRLDSEWAGNMTDPDAKMHVAINELADLIDVAVGTGRWVH